MCSHEISFSIDAGLNDILNVHFAEVEPGTILHMAVGIDFDTADGQILEEPRGIKLKVAFPNKIFLTVEHRAVEDVLNGVFAFEFWYTD